MNGEPDVQLLIDLVSIPSLSREEREASEFLVSWLGSHGFRAGVDEAGNAVGVRGEGDREILLLGHIDTFPGEVPVRREGDLLYGRGSVDAKGPLCAFALAASGVEVKEGYRITVVGAVEEEAATSKGARHVVAGRAGGEGGAPIVCVIGEPSRWDRITLGYKGRLLVDVKTVFPFSHSAGPDRLPAERTVDLWREVEAYCEEKDRELGAKGPFDRLLPSLRGVVTRDRGAHGEGELTLGFRLPVAVSPTALETELRELFAASKTAAGGYLEQTFHGAERAHRGNKSNPLVRSFLRAIRAAGGDPRFVVKTGTSDMNVVAPHWPNTPIVAYGPGDSSLDHTPDEHVSLAEFRKSVEVLQGMLEGLMA